MEISVTQVSNGCIHSVTRYKLRDEPEWRAWPGVTSDPNTHQGERL